MSQAEAFERCMAVGGIAVFPADTVYGLACDPRNREAVERLYLLKRRAERKPAAVMFFIGFFESQAVFRLGVLSMAMAHVLMGAAVLWVAQVHMSWPLLLPFAIVQEQHHLQKSRQRLLPILQLPRRQAR